MLPDRISRTSVYLLRLCLLAAVITGSTFFDYSPPTVLAQLPGDNGFDTSGAATSTPVVNFSGHTTTGLSPQEVQFTDESTESPTGWNTYSGDDEFAWKWVRSYLLRDGRSLATSVALPDGSIVLMGGTGHSIYYHDVQRSTDASAAWWTQMIGSAEWTARSAHTSVVISDGSIVLMGGSNGGSNFNDVWHSTDKGITWTQMTSSAEWTARDYLTSVALPDDSIVLMGGDDGSNRLNDVWRSIDQGATWTQVTASADWTGRSGHTSVALPDGSIVLMGGNDGTNRLNDVWRSTDQGATWTEMTGGAEWTARNSHTSVALPDGNFVLMGGYEGSYKRDVWHSTDMGSSWTQMTGYAEWESRSAHTSVSLPDGSIVLMCGFRSQGLGLNTWYKDVWRSTDQGATWTRPAYAGFAV
jgi:hypothetical protein